jgi:hypothetical protein
MIAAVYAHMSTHRQQEKLAELPEVSVYARVRGI